MKKKTAAPPQTPRRKTAPRIRPSETGKPKVKIPLPAGTLWDDDRAFRVLMKNSSDIFTLVDSKGKILYRSPSARRLIKLPEKAVLQSNFLEWMWPDDMEEVKKLFSSMLQSPGKSVPFQARIKNEAGLPRWVEGIGANHLADPAVGAVLINCHDITDRKRQELALQENERRYRELFENATLAIFQSTFDGKVIRVNPEFARLFGYASPEDVASSIRNVAVDLFADPARREEIVQLRTKDPNLSKFENFYRRKDGSTLWGLLNIRTVLDSEGRPAYFEGFIEDISDRKQAEQALRESVEKFRSIFENSSAGVALVGLDWRYLMVNPAFCSITGHTEAELLQSGFLDLTHPDDLELSRKSMQDVLDGRGKNVRFVKRYLHKDGHTILADVSSALVHGADGKPSHFVTHVLDITERRRVEEALWESEGKASAIMASAPFGITFVNSAGVITYVNPAAERILGLRRGETVPPTYNDARWKITAPDGSPFPPGEFPFTRVMATGKPVYGVEHTIQRETGERALLLINGAPLFKPDGTISGMVATIQDVTESRRAEAALRESEERYRSLFNSSLEGIGLSQGNRIIDANKTLLEILGYADLEELRAVPLLDTVAPGSRDYIAQRMREATTERQKRFTYKCIRKNGEKRDLEISTDHLSIGGDLFTLTTFRDITESRKAEEELRALAVRHEALLSAIPEIIMEVDNSKIYTWANPAGIEFFGEGVVGREAADYFEGEQDVYSAVQPLFDGKEGTVYLESWQRRKDGEKRLLAWWCRNLKNDRGEVTGALSSARDITEQRMAEDQIQSLSRFPTENPNPVMRMAPDGELLYANNASRPFLDMWKIEVGQSVPEECRVLIGDVYVTNANRDVEIICEGRIYTCDLTPIQSAGYVNVYGRDITERKQAEQTLAKQAEELRQRNADLARLNERSEGQMRRLIAMRAIDTAITSSFKLELVLNILLGQMGDLLGAHAADILIFQPDLQTFRFCCGRGFNNVIPQQAYLRKAESYANQAAQERRILRVPRLDERTDAAKIYPKIAGEGFSSYLCLPLLAKGLVKGVLEIFHRTELQLEPEDESFLEMVAGQAAIAIDNAELFEGLQSTNDELTLAYNDTLTGWARTLELRDRETAGEAQRLADMTVRLAHSMGSSENEMVLMYRGAILHDIGIMGIPDSVLLKTGPLTEEEWTVVRKHPQFAHDLLSPINYLRSALDIPYCHHEKWDGSGYPRGLKGGQIPFSARIFAVVDVWDALHSDRPYRRAWTDAEAREFIQQQSGKHFDPAVVKAFLEIIPTL